MQKSASTQKRTSPLKFENFPSKIPIILLHRIFRLRSASKEAFLQANPPKFKWNTSVRRVDGEVVKIFDGGVAVHDLVERLDAVK